MILSATESDTTFGAANTDRAIILLHALSPGSHPSVRVRVDGLSAPLRVVSQVGRRISFKSRVGSEIRERVELLARPTRDRVRENCVPHREEMRPHGWLN